MFNLLLWLGLPLPLLVFVVRRDRLGSAASQLIIAGLGLGALHQGVGTLDPRDLRALASQSLHAGWFIGVTAGVLITGACLGPELGKWRRLLVATPLLIGVSLSIPAGALVAVLIGAAIGVIPIVVAGIFPRPHLYHSSTVATSHARIASGRSGSVILGLLTVASVAVAPLALTFAGLCGLTWREWSRLSRTRLLARIPALPIGASILLAAWLWLALTIAVSPLVGWRSFATDAPVSLAASLWLALLAIGWAIAIAAPWPADGLADVTVQLPVVAVVLYLVAHGASEGMAHWQPLLTMILVPVTIMAAARRKWDGAAAALTLLAATRPGAESLVAAVMVGVVPAVRRYIGAGRLVIALAGISVAVLVAIVARDEVVLAVVLALGLAIIAARYDHVIAPA